MKGEIPINGATLKLLTFNIRKGRGPHHRRVDLDEIESAVAEVGADLTLCQEVFHCRRRSEHQQSNRFARRLSVEHAYGANAHYRRGHHGNATFSRYPIVGSINHDLSTNPIEKRGALHATIRHPLRDLHVLNIHLGLNHGQRRRQIALIAEAIDRATTSNAAVVLAGDFNDWRDRLDEEVRHRCGLENAFARTVRRERFSWPNFRPMFSLDRIYYRGLTLKSATVLRDDRFRLLSDHLPVFAEFEVKPKQADESTSVTFGARHHAPLPMLGVDQ